MALSDLFFGTDFFNRLGRKNIRGDELAALLAGALGANIGKGAMLAQTGSQSIPPSVITIVSPFNSLVYDDLSLAAPGLTGFIIPATGVSRVWMYAACRWFPGGTPGTGRDISFFINGTGTARGTTQNRYFVDASLPPFVFATTPPLNVSPGDLCQMTLTNFDSGAETSADHDFAIVVSQ